MNKKNRACNSANVLYTTAKQFAKVYKDEILENYSKVCNVSIDLLFNSLSPAEIIDDLAMFMYEYEEKNFEEVLW